MHAERLVPQRHPTGGPRLESEQRAHQLGPPRAHQPGDPEDLAAPELEAGMFQGRRRGDVLHGEDHLRGTRVGACGEEPRHGAAHHLRDQVVVAHPRDEPRIDAAAVAEDGISVGDVPDLLEEMADVDHRDPACRQAPDQCEEALHLLALKAAGRLVHQEDARVPRQGAADLHHLPRGEGQLRHAAVGIQLRAAEVAQESERAPPGRAPIDPAPACRLDPEQDVLRHGQVRAEGELLVDEGDAAPPRLERGGRSVRPAVEMHRAAIGTHGAGYDVHEGALAGAVFPDQGVHLARAEREVDPVERQRRREPFGDVADPQHAHCSMR